jgi:hypothetical protein
MGSSLSMQKTPRVEKLIGLPYGEVLDTLKKQKINIQLVAVKSDELYTRNNVPHPKVGVTVIYDCLTHRVKNIFIY